MSRSFPFFRYIMKYIWITKMLINNEFEIFILKFFVKYLFLMLINIFFSSKIKSSFKKNRVIFILNFMWYIFIIFLNDSLLKLAKKIFFIRFFLYLYNYSPYMISIIPINLCIELSGSYTTYVCVLLC